MSETSPLEGALSRLASAVKEAGLTYAIIGGIAVILRGHDRATQDVDAVVMKLDEHLGGFLASAERHGLQFRIPDGLDFARSNRVILLEAPDGTPVDISMGVLPFEEDVVRYADLLAVGEGLSVPVASVEDLLIMKLTAGRRRDYEDVASLLELYPNINHTRVRSIVVEYSTLLESPELVERMNQFLG